ncbi:MAG: chorismate-binding protein, partial [Candidatus Omnitrophica bacterium]|nr:chorismate-binding protein [Candidatus Omnitrophota bacterium]
MNILIEFEKKPLLFTRPHAVVCCVSPSLLAGSLREVERFLQSGYYVAGFISYEAGYCFEERLNERKEYGFPLLVMGAYRKPASRRFSPGRKDAAAVSNLRLNIALPAYARNIDRIRSYINSGEVYQITYCIKLAFTFRGNAQSLYAALLYNQPVPYPAYIDTGQFKILSLSPERFFKKNGDKITVEPMKGT